MCLDAECGNYEQVWCTTSLRGNLIGNLRVRVLTEGVHSGMATGIAPTAFRILEQLLARIENPGDRATCCSMSCTSHCPQDRRAAGARRRRRCWATRSPASCRGCQGVQPLSNDPTELIINNTWRATLAVTGAEGLPPLGSAGNVLLPEIAVQALAAPAADLRCRRAPRRRSGEALERDPPYGAQVSFDALSATGGWNAPALAPWLEESITAASRAIYGREAVHIGCGGTIPFMGMLGEQFPQTQFFITGVLGPHANAHGPNEFLHLDYAKKLTACVSLVLAEPRSARCSASACRPCSWASPRSLRRCQPSRYCAAASAGASKSAVANSAAQRIEHQRPLGQALGELAAPREHDPALDRHLARRPP